MKEHNEIPIHVANEEGNSAKAGVIHLDGRYTLVDRQELAQLQLLKERYHLMIDTMLSRIDQGEDVKLVASNIRRWLDKDPAQLPEIGMADLVEVLRAIVRLEETPLDRSDPDFGRLVRARTVARLHAIERAKALLERVS